MWRKAEFGYYDISLYRFPLLVDYDYDDTVNGWSVNKLWKILHRTIPAECAISPVARQSITSIKAEHH